jgi:hypothetical protein
MPFRLEVEGFDPGRGGSAKISIDPPGDFEPLEGADKAMFWTVGAMEAFTKSATLNKRAARWTAASVLLSTTAGVLGNVL